MQKYKRGISQQNPASQFVGFYLYRALN